MNVGVFVSIMNSWYLVLEYSKILQKPQSLVLFPSTMIFQMIWISQ